LKQNKKNRIFLNLIILILILNFLIPQSLTQKIEQNNEAYNFMDEGQILYSPMWNTNTYLIECTGTLNHSWSSNFLPGASVWWLGDGTILRSIRVGTGPGTGGTGGGVQIVEWDETIIWDFRYNTNGVMSHHDVKSLPNGNVLMIAWESKSRTEAIAAGRNPNYVGFQGLMPDHIIEVKPTGPTTGDIVWEWHVWDHLVQDYDPSKDNYGNVADHPELVDINYRTSSQADLMHTNSIDYNEEFDQILLSVCYFNEIWIIDHSTSKEEAAGHTGGNSGKGGDLLYRWGNPAVYDAGSSSEQKLFRQHDATWIDEGCPGEGNILVFNNGANRPGSHYSTVDEIIPPVNEFGEYYLEEGDAYGPESQTWMYTGNPPTSFYSDHLSGAWRLPSGNTLITNGAQGRLFEVTPLGQSVWQYNTGGQLFKVVYIPPEEPPEPEIPDLDCQGVINYVDVNSGSTVDGTFEVSNKGGPGSILNWEIESYPDWGTWTFSPESGVDLHPEDEAITVELSIIIPQELDTFFEGYIKVINKDDAEDSDLIPVYIKTPRQKTIDIIFLKYFRNFPFISLIMKIL
jgi:hypothetical protein